MNSIANIILIYNLSIEFQFLVLIESFVNYIPEISISIEILFGQIVWIQPHPISPSPCLSVLNLKAVQI